ncbi:hypothetical protein [Sinorhizobium americanum]|uniref:hypothetical protein n=1 Tax=Sinorhizobium americanum TaxID=194963 RepID=UPI0012903796|nr:hypothetical protein [Sinorhizobium americanum]
MTNVNDYMPRLSGFHPKGGVPLKNGTHQVRTNKESVMVICSTQRDKGVVGLSNRGNECLLSDTAGADDSISDHCA